MRIYLLVAASLSTLAFASPVPPELREQIVLDVTDGMPLKAGSWIAYPIDLNKDGQDEYAVNHLNSCGSAGCSLYIFEHDQAMGRWWVIYNGHGRATVPDHLPAVIQDQRTNGWQDLLFHLQTETVSVRHEGKRYSDARSEDTDSYVS